MRSFLPPIRGHRPWRAVGGFNKAKGDYDRYGWFVSCGINCPLYKNIHWGKRRGWVLAWADTLRGALSTRSHR